MSLKIVYVLSNPAMPGLVKIGRTDHDDANLRISQLYTTGVPVPFTLEFACKVTNAEDVERALHIAFAPNRINPKREFFQIEAQQAIAILKLLHTEDATLEVEQQPAGLDQQSISAAEHLKSRRPNLNFVEMNIPIGSILQATKDDSVVTVISQRKIDFNGEEMSLTAATRLVLGIEYDVAPGPFWTFRGKRISDIYEETYGNIS